jgi:hypothetical protein
MRKGSQMENPVKREKKKGIKSSGKSSLMMRNE